MIRKTKKITLAILLVVGIAGQSVFGQAYCALRDPEVEIKSMFPMATSFRSVVRTVDGATRDQINKLLPPHTLHFGELGRHSLYVAVENDKPLGFVHVRSESMKWGLMEVAWSLDLDLRVRDFRLQRCRDRNRTKIENETFRSQFKGLSFADFRTKISEDGDKVLPEKLRLPESAEDIATSLVFCGLKTLLTTELVWKDYITKVRGQDLFGNPNIEHVSSIKGQDEIYSDGIMKQLDEFGIVGESNGLDRKSAKIAVLSDKGVIPIGVLFYADLDVGGRKFPSTWAVSASGEILKARVSGTSPEVVTAFEGLEQMSLKDEANCSSQLELIACEVLLASGEAIRGQSPVDR